MNDKRALIDSNILVHAYAISDDRKHGIAHALVKRIWEGEGAVTAIQNLCEFFFVVTRRVAKPLSAEEAEAAVSGILAGSQWRVIDRQSQTVIEAMRLVKLHGASLWDALIAACMLEHDVTTIVTENERDFRKIPGLTVINPFKARAKHDG